MVEHFGALIDTHAHLADPVFDPDRAAVLARAARVGVEAVLVAGENTEDNELVLQVCAQHPEILKPCLGLYPEGANLEKARVVGERIKEMAHSLTAISEVGLDFHLEAEAAGRAQQEEALVYFAQLSRETGLPLSVHSRSAGKRVIALLRERGVEKVVLHAFDGKASRAAVGVEAGFFFSIPPSLIRSRQKEKLVAALPLDHILLESDAPVLGPVPNKRNEPALLAVTVERIAEIKGVAPAQVAALTRENSHRLFGF